jgi:hypothetical protein
MGPKPKQRKSSISAKKIWSWTFDRLAQGAIKADMA